MSYDGLLLFILTTRHRYVAQREQILELRILASDADWNRPDERDTPMEMEYVELGPLLDPEDTPAKTRRHALVVPTPDRSVALLVDRIEDLWLESGSPVQMFPPFFTRQLRRPWFPGAMLHQDEPVLLLDLSQIARDVLHMQASTRDGDGTRGDCKPDKQEGITANGTHLEESI
jgi:hypothetical protein